MIFVTFCGENSVSESARQSAILLNLQAERPQLLAEHTVSLIDLSVPIRPIGG